MVDLSGELAQALVPLDLLGLFGCSRRLMNILGSSVSKLDCGEPGAAPAVASLTWNCGSRPAARQ